MIIQKDYFMKSNCFSPHLWKFPDHDYHDYLSLLADRSAGGEKRIE